MTIIKILISVVVVAISALGQPVLAQPDSSTEAAPKSFVTKSLHVSPDGVYLAQLARKYWREDEAMRYDPQGTSISLWELGGGRLKWQKYSKLNSLFKGVFSAESKHLLVYGTNLRQEGTRVLERQQRAEVWALESGEEPVSLALNQSERLEHMIFLPDGKSVMGLLYAVDGQNAMQAYVRLWDAQTGQLLRSIDDKPQLAQKAAWAANAHILTVAINQAWQDGKNENELIAWSLPELTRLGAVPMGTDSAMKVTLSPDGKKVAYMIYDGKPAQKEIYLWDLESKEVNIIETPKLRVHHTLNLEFTSDSRFLTAAGFFNDEKRTWINEVWFWNAQTGDLERSLNQHGDLTISPHGFCLVPKSASFIAYTLEHKVEQRSLEDGALIHTFE